MDDTASRDEFARRLAGAGLQARTEQMLSQARPSVRLVPDPSAVDVVGRSRIGGDPDLPPSTEWPRRDGSPLGFVAQVDLAAVQARCPTDELPADGLLSFFYDCVEQPWGFDPADRGSWAVIHTPASTPLQAHNPPPDLPAGARFRSVGLAPRPELTVLPFESYQFDQFGLDQDEAIAYVDTLPDQDRTIHRLLGHPDHVQGDMTVECQLASNGIYCGDGDFEDDPKAVRLMQAAGDWRLLLQLDSEDAADMMWGDCGRLYFWIRDDDLAARRWDQVWLVLQCG